jgi:hypothetical protein
MGQGPLGEIIVKTERQSSCSLRIELFLPNLKIRKIISVFLLLVLCIQLLPLKQTISWLLGNQVTEELVHTDDTGKKGRSGDDLHKHFLPVYYPTLVPSVLPSSLTALSHQAEGLEGRHADDILTPPPNC